MSICAFLFVRKGKKQLEKRKCKNINLHNFYPHSKFPRFSSNTFPTEQSAGIWDNDENPEDHVVLIFFSYKQKVKNCTKLFHH